MQSVPSFNSIVLTALFSIPALASAAVVQTNYGTTDGSLPGGSPIVAADNLLHTSLVSVSRTGEGAANPDNQYFYGEDGNGSIQVDLTRLYDGQFGGAGTVTSASVLPNQVSLTFSLNLVSNPAGYDISTIKTYAGWDSGRDAQQYTVEYSTASAPGVFLSLASPTKFDNTSFPSHLEWQTNWETYQEEEVLVTDESQASTLVLLKADSGLLATNVAALRFNFSGVENRGTAFREFVIEGSGTAPAISSVPEPAALFGTMGLLASGMLLRRRTMRPR